MSKDLISWTRTLNEDDALRLIDLARPGMSIEEWQEQAHATLPQARRERRTELVRIVRDELLDHDGRMFTASSYLKLFHDGTPHRRLGLLYGRRVFRRPLVARALDALLVPALEALEAPLAPRDAGTITRDQWNEFLANNLRPGTGPESVKKTRSVLQKNLCQLGVLEVSGRNYAVSCVRRAEPDPLAFCWLIRHEMRVDARLEASLEWATKQAFSTRLFLARASYAEGCLERGVRAELFRRSYLAGAERLHLVHDSA